MGYNFGNIEEKRLEILDKTNKKIRIGKLIYPFFGFLVIKSAKDERKKFARSIKSRIINYILEKNYKNAVYFPNDRIQLGEIMNTKLYDYPDRCKGEDLITGMYKNINFDVCDYQLFKIVKRTVKIGDSFVETETEKSYFNGRWFHYEFKRKFEGHVIIVEKSKTLDSAVTRLNGYKKYETESIAFNEKFDCYTNNEDLLFYLLTPLIIDKLIVLEEIHRGKINFSFLNNCFDVAINDGKDYLEPIFEKPVTEEGYQDLISQIEIIGAIINELNLDGIKFNEKKGC